MNFGNFFVVSKNSVDLFNGECVPFATDAKPTSSREISTDAEEWNQEKRGVQADLDEF